MRWFSFIEWVFNGFKGNNMIFVLERLNSHSNIIVECEHDLTSRSMTRIIVWHIVNIHYAIAAPWISLENAPLRTQKRTKFYVKQIKFLFWMVKLSIWICKPKNEKQKFVKNCMIDCEEWGAVMNLNDCKINGVIDW